MKKAAIFLMAFAVIGSANAALLARNNGGFDASAAGWNATGGGGAWAAGYGATGGNPGGYVTLQSANNTWSVWYQVINESLAVWGIPAGTTITASVDMIDLGTLGNNDVGGLKAESWLGATKLTPGDGVNHIFTVTNSWATYSFDYTMEAGADAIKLVFVNVNYDAGGTARFGFDNASIGLPGELTPALLPVPIVGDNGVAPTSDVLSWTNPDPNYPSDTITCDVWFRDGGTTPLTDPNLVPGQPGAVQIINDEAISSVDLSTEGITLEQDHYYYWKVNVTDPNSGGPVTTNGFTWSFNTGDAPPEPNAGPDQYVWLTGDPNTVPFTLSGSVVDDGKSAVTTLWSLNPLTQTDPETIVTITDPNALTTTVTVDNTGWFFFDLTATDAAGSGVDTVNVGVYVDACAAANADPTDIPATYPDGHGDIDGDCDVDLDDFAIMASTWLDCLSAKLGC